MSHAAERTVTRVQDQDDVQGTPAEGDTLIYNTTLGVFLYGPPASGADAHYTHTQSAAASVWSITHNMGKHPSVMVVDTGGTTVEGDVVYLNVNQIELRFSVPFSGFAYLN